MKMGEQADEERLAELNRNKERYEQMHEEQQRGEERQLHDDVRETRRRNSLQEQREKEEQKAEVEASADKIAEGRKQYRIKKDMEDSADRIAAGRAKYRQDKQEIEDSAVKIAEGRQKYRNQQETEATAMHMAMGRQKYRDAMVEDAYRKNTPLKTQLFDSLFGRERPEKKVQPITTLGGAVKYKVKERAGGAVTSFFEEMSRPAKAVKKGREERREGRATKMIDPFQQGAPVRKKRARGSNSRTPVREGTGMLFTEGFFNPPRRAGRKSKKGGGGYGGVADFLL